MSTKTETAITDMIRASLDRLIKETEPDLRARLRKDLETDLGKFMEWREARQKTDVVLSQILEWLTFDARFIFKSRHEKTHGHGEPLQPGGTMPYQIRGYAGDIRGRERAKMRDRLLAAGRKPDSWDLSMVDTIVAQKMGNIEAIGRAIGTTKDWDNGPVLYRTIERLVEEATIQIQTSFRDKNLVKITTPVMNKVKALGCSIDAIEIAHYREQAITAMRGSLSFRFPDGSWFRVDNEVVHSVNQQGTRYVRFPLTFHDVKLGDDPATGKEVWMKTPSEAKMNNLFKTPLGPWPPVAQPSGAEMPVAEPSVAAPRRRRPA